SMENDPVADDRSLSQRDARIQQTVVADTGFVSDIAAGAENGAVTVSGSGFEAAMRLVRAVFAKLVGGGYDSGGTEGGLVAAGRGFFDAGEAGNDDIGTAGEGAADNLRNLAGR